MKRIGQVLLLAALVSGAGVGQEFRATLTGRILDGSGSAIPTAKIEAKFAGTNEVATATSDVQGNYTIPFLRPGQYSITVTAPGFKTYSQESLTLQVGRVVGLNITLEVGLVTESISVTAEAALLETATASRVGVVTERHVTELPLNSRNPFMLGAMMSGVTFRGAAIWQRPFDNGAIAEWSVNGGRQSNNEFLMDGAPNNAQAGNNNIAYVPIVDAVQEFSVQQNSYDAQYGKTGGGVFNVVLKSGTNDFHVTAWEFMRRKALDANTFQNNAVGSPRPDHLLDQYGFQLSGPLHIPKLVRKDGRIKGFFLGSYEGYRELWPQFLRNSYPEPEMRQGDFSKLTNAANQSVIIYDPFSAVMDANGNPIRSPFPGNKIPDNRIHPVAKAVTKYMPAPNAVTPGVGYARQNVLNPEYPAGDDFYNLILKFDFSIGDNHRTFIRHASNDRTEDRCSNGICSGPGMDGQQPFQRINDAYVLDWISTLSPTLVLNVRASHNRFIEKGFGRGNVDFDLASLGLPQSLLSTLPGPVYFGRWNFADYSSMGRTQSINITNNYGLMGNVTKIAGSHTMKFGVDLRRIHYITQNSGEILRFDGERRWTQRIYNQAEPNAGDSYASFLIGGVAGQSNYPLYPFTRQWYLAPYFQDDWKVSRRLTLNLGLRWDYNGPPDEKYDRINRGFNPTLTSPIASQIPADMLALYPHLKDLKGGLEFAGVNGLPRTVSKKVYTNWQPRVGAAYQLRDRIVLRGGYGLYTMNANNNYLLFQGFSTNTTMVNTLDGGRTLIPGLFDNPYPDGINKPVGSSLGPLQHVGNNTTWFNPNFTSPYVHQFSFGFQTQVSQFSSLDISYVGSRTIGANGEKDFNIPSLDFRKQCNILEGGSPAFCNQQIPNPFRGIEAFRGTTMFTAANLSRFQLARPFPQFSGNMLEQGRNDSNIWYNSLQVNYNHRVGRDLTLLGNYTLSKMVESWQYLDPHANVQQRGLYFNDRPHILKMTVVYALPFGKGRRIGGNSSSFVQKLIGGWEFNTYYNHSSGEPNNLPGNAIMLKDPRVSDIDWKAHQIRGWSPCVLRMFDDGTVAPQQYSLNAGCGTDHSNYAWLQTAAFAPRRMNPERSGQIRKHRAFTMDSSLNKTTQITERLRVQIGFEAFNVMNHNYFGRNDGFNTDPNNPNFGTQFPSQASNQNGYPRQIQIRMKAYW